MALSKIDAANFLTGTIPSGNIATASLSAAAVGKIGQVVTQSLNTVQTISTTGSFQASGLTLNITPSASSSTIFLLATIQYSTNAADYNGSFAFFRDTTIIGAAADASNRIGSMSMGRGDSSYSRPVPLSYIDSPSSTSQITYSVKFYPEPAATHYLNRTGQDSDQAHKGRSASTLTAFEVLA